MGQLNSINNLAYANPDGEHSTIAKAEANASLS